MLLEIDFELYRSRNKIPRLSRNKIPSLPWKTIKLVASDEGSFIFPKNRKVLQTPSAWLSLQFPLCLVPWYCLLYLVHGLGWIWWNHLSELFHIQKQFDLCVVNMPLLYQWSSKIVEQLAYGICLSYLVHLIMTLLIFCRSMRGFLSQLLSHGSQIPRIIHHIKLLYSQRGIPFLVLKLWPSIDPIRLKSMFCMLTWAIHKLPKK
jgi:hypothetical protein